MAMLSRIATVCCHVSWLVSCLPGWVKFRWALERPRAAQERILRRLIRANRSTPFGRDHEFGAIATPDEFAARVPLSEYEDFARAIDAVRGGAPYGLCSESPELLEPTSGSSSAPKLIPVTRALWREFAAAVEPWIAWLCLAHPSVMLGRHYWAVSPNTPAGEARGRRTEAVPVGFSDDADYLGWVGRFVSRHILATPDELRHVTDPDAYSRLTLLFLLADRELRLISVWHPSFFTHLLEAIPRHWPELLTALRTGELPTRGVPEPVRSKLAARFRRDVRRAEELGALNLAEQPQNLSRAWPRLAIISCWGGASAEPWVSRLRELFPGACFQPKGLLATEGCVSIPTGCGRKHPCAVTSHYLEFVDTDTGAIRRVWELSQNREYSVVLSTGGGFWRYRVHDRVRVVDYCRRTPCLEFVGKDNAVSDLVGEKLGERHVAEALAAVRTELGRELSFAMVVPAAAETVQRAGYLLLYELNSPNSVFDASRAVDLLEIAFCTNYHYAHARRLGQLESLRALKVERALERYRAARTAAGARLGTIKVPALEVSRQLPTGWWTAENHRATA